MFSGRRAVGRWFRDWFTTFGDTAHFDLRELVDAGDSVVVSAHHRARGGLSGIEINADLFYVYRIRDGKICRIEFHASREEARAAAGLTGESDIDVVRRGYALFNAGDFAVVADLLHPDVVIETVSGQRLVGREAVVALWKPEAIAWQRLEPLEIRQHGNRVLVRLRVRAHGHHVWTLRDGLAVRLVDTADERRAREAFYR